MIKKRVTTKAAAERSVTAERARRLHQLLKLLSGAPQTRSLLTKRLKLDIRGFYRDLEVLREAGIEVHMNARKYLLDLDFKKAVNLLPFPDPHLTLGEAALLVKGTSKAHRKLRELLKQIVNA
jgi:predicted DNA-binding transcriptional regulator YafY